MKKIIFAVMAIGVSALASAGQTLKEQTDSVGIYIEQVTTFVDKCNLELENDFLLNASSRSQFKVQDPFDYLVWEPFKKRIQFSSASDKTIPYQVMSKLMMQLLEKAGVDWKSLEKNQEQGDQFLENDLPKLMTAEISKDLLSKYQDELRLRGGDVKEELGEIQYDPKDPVVQSWLTRTIAFNQVKSKTKNGKLACTSEMFSEAYSNAVLTVSKITECTGFSINAFPLMFGAHELVCDGQVISSFQE